MELIKLKGVTEKRLKELNKMGIFTPEDLVRFYPRAYLDLTHRVKLSSCYHNDMALVACRVASPPQTVYTGRRNFIKVWCDQEGELFSVVWFNAPYVKDKLKEGEYLFYGRVQNRYGTVSMVNPSFEPLDKNYRLKGIVPVYSLKGSLTQRAVRDMISSALKVCLPQTVIPAAVARKYGLASLSQAYLDIHNPPSEAAWTVL